MARKRNIIISIAVFIIILLVAYTLISEKSVRDFLYFARGVPEGSCASGDINCITEKKMSGVEVAYAKHQCDSPKGCRTPDDKDIKAATEAIRFTVKNPKLQIIPINGITPAGIMYYCANDNRCWSVEAKTNTVISSVGKLLETPTPSKREVRTHP